MKRFMAIVGAAILAAVLAACGSDNTTSTTDTGSGTGATTPVATPTPTPEVLDPNKVISIDGQSYTCGQVIDAENQVCDEGYQRAFENWGDNLVKYMNSGKLGPLRKVLRYEDVAAFGLAACIIAERGEGQDEFVAYMHSFHPDEDSVAFVALWNGARRYLCTDAFATPGYRSTDLRVE